MADLPEVAERLARWPDNGEPGQFVIQCSCGQWSSTGTVAEINAAAIQHDDSPWQNHVVSIYGRLP
ncbi:MAG TPA: hypothetical protein VGS19_28985 [Streptosporangiaceae bacterium]|nr:hypothetical protein [Streptosporangiaceae bacterium]